MALPQLLHTAILTGVSKSCDLLIPLFDLDVFFLGTAIFEQPLIIFHNSGPLLHNNVNASREELYEELALLSKIWI
jgi:hypothetical protein